MFHIFQDGVRLSVGEDDPELVNNPPASVSTSTWVTAGNLYLSGSGGITDLKYHRVTGVGQNCLHLCLDSFPNKPCRHESPT